MRCSCLLGRAHLPVLQCEIRECEGRRVALAAGRGDARNNLYIQEKEITEAQFLFKLIEP